MNPVPRLDLSSTTGGRRTHAPPSHSARRSTASGGLKASRRTSARGYHSARRAATNSGRTSNTMKGMSRSQTARNREDTDAWGNRYPYANHSLQHTDQNHRQISLTPAPSPFYSYPIDSVPWATQRRKQAGAAWGPVVKIVAPRVGVPSAAFAKLRNAPTVTLQDPLASPRSQATAHSLQPTRPAGSTRRSARSTVRDPSPIRLPAGSTVDVGASTALLSTSGAAEGGRSGNRGARARAKLAEDARPSERIASNYSLNVGKLSPRLYMAFTRARREAMSARGGRMSARSAGRRRTAPPTSSFSG